MLPQLVAAAAFFPITLAFYDTVPLVAWSSHENSLVSMLSENAHPELQVESLWSGEDVCMFDVVVVIEQPGLHAYDLKTLPPSSSVPSALKRAHKAAQVPYVRRSATDESGRALEESVEELARRCGARMLWMNVGGELDVGFERQREGEGEGKESCVVHVSAPEVYGEGAWRRCQMSELEDALSRTLDTIESTFPNHLILYTGSFPSSSALTKRQSTAESIDPPFAFAPSNSSASTGGGGGILAKYQILTPGLILSLLIAFFVLVPVVLLAIKALASIQSSVRLDAPKGPTQSKKNQ